MTNLPFHGHVSQHDDLIDDYPYDPPSGGVEIGKL